MFANFHFHSSHSDGPDSVETLVNLAVQEGYRALALTDHDTVTGVLPIMKECNKYGIDCMVGCEFSGLHNGECFHIVGLDFDLNNPNMTQYLNYMSSKCIERTKMLFDSAVAKGNIKGITWDEVADDHREIAFLCVDHVFSSMKNRGLITDDGYSDFWENNFCAPFDNSYYKSVREVISLINEAGGIAVLAHPKHRQMDLLPELLQYGLKGIEAWHPDHTDEEALRAEELAAKYKLYICGGTDHSGIMGGQYRFYENKVENPYYIPSLKYGVSEKNYTDIKNRIYG